MQSSHLTQVCFSSKILASCKNSITFDDRVTTFHINTIASVLSYGEEVKEISLTSFSLACFENLQPSILERISNLWWSTNRALNFPFLSSVPKYIPQFLK